MNKLQIFKIINLMPIMIGGYMRRVDNYKKVQLFIYVWFAIMLFSGIIALITTFIFRIKAFKKPEILYTEIKLMRLYQKIIIGLYVILYPITYIILIQKLS